MLHPALRAAALLLPLACGCASVGSLARGGHTGEAWQLACEQHLNGTGSLAPDERDALRTAIHEHTTLAIQARASEPAGFFARIGPDILTKPAVVVQMSVAASAHPGAGIRVVPGLRLAAGAQSAWRGPLAWTYAGISVGTPDSSAHYNLLGALGDALAAVVGQNPMWRGTSSILPERVPGTAAVGTEAQIMAFSAIGPAGGNDCISRLGESCDSVLLLAPGTAKEPLRGDLQPLELGTEGPASGDALELHVVQMSAASRDITCDVAYTVAVPLPPGATLAARVQAALTSPLASPAAAATPPPPPDAALALIEQGHLTQACARLEKESFPDASFAERHDRALAMRALAAKMKLAVTARLRTTAEINAEIGAPLLHGETVPVAFSITLDGPELNRITADVSLHHDGTLWQSALRYPAAHDALRLLFGAGAGTGLPTYETATSARAGDPREPAAGLATPRLAMLDEACLYSIKNTCQATVPLARTAPILAPDTFSVQVRATFGQYGDCTLPMTWSAPLPPGAGLQERLSALFARGALALDIQ